MLTEGEEGVLKVSLDPDVNPEYARFLIGNHLWHMDGTYEEIPPLATLFTPFKLSRTGGDTCFANTYAAFEDLPEADKARLETLRVVHTMQAALFPAKRDCTPEEFAVWSSYPERSHPLVWHHKSGRKSLVLSTSGAYVEGMHPAESHDLLQRLMAHATQDKYVYRHKWQLGDLVIWDNTGAMHRVLPFDKDSGREFHRCTLNGGRIHHGHQRAAGLGLTIIRNFQETTNMQIGVHMGYQKPSRRKRHGFLPPRDAADGRGGSDGLRLCRGGRASLHGLWPHVPIRSRR